MKKTKHIRFSSGTTHPPPTYAVNDTIVETASSIKYLGIFLSCDLTWNSCLEYIANKSFKKVSLLKRRLKCANADTKLQAYKTFIRPSLEYASTIWHPHTAILTDTLESLQNKAARFICSCYSSYQSFSLLKHNLNLPSLAMRRKLSRLSFFHSLYNSDTTFS